MFQNGFAFKPDDWGEDGWPIIRIQNLTRETALLNRTLLKVPEKCHVNKGDLLYSWSATLDAYIWQGEHAVLNQHIFRVTPEPGVEKLYLYYTLKNVSKAMRERTHGSTMKHVTKKVFEQYRVPLPPLDEQRRIVEVLERAAGIRRLREQALEKARALIPALFLDMFGDPATNPKGWPRAPLANLVQEFRYGTSKKCSEQAADDHLPILRIPNVVGDTVDWGDLKFSALDTKEKRKLVLRRGDLLFVRTNGNPAYIGRCVAFAEDHEAAFASYLIRARPKSQDEADALFLREHISLPAYRPRVLRAARTTAGQYNMSIEGLSGLEIVQPPAVMIRRFADRVADIRTIIAHQERSLDAARALERSLMARLLG